MHTQPNPTNQGIHRPTPPARGEAEDNIGLARLEEIISRCPISDPAILEEERSRLRAIRTALLRERWGAPKRHLAAKVDRTGAWGDKLAAIESRLGTGALFGMYGSRGNGKTQIAVEAMRTATGLGFSARYMTAIDLFMRLKATFQAKATESEPDVIADLRKPRLLVIDEIGKRGESIWENNLLFGLIDARYRDLTDTIIIANLDRDQFIDAIGGSLARRMSETGGLIRADWPSRR